METVYSLCILNNIKHQLLFKMNDPLVDLQQMLSSEDQQQQIVQEAAKISSQMAEKKPSIKQYMFNLKYNIMHSNIVHIPYFHRPKISLQLDSEPAYLLGVPYQYPANEKFIQHFRSIVWMSYRSVSSNGKGDVGWGCMIRVVQMLFIEVFKRLNPTASVYDIIELFKQGKNHILSLENICASGKIKQRWTGPNQILLAVCSIINSSFQKQNQKNQQKKCFQSAPSKFESKCLNTNLKVQIFCEQLSIENIQQVSPNQGFPKLVVISSKVAEEGNSYFPDIYSGHAKHLMKMPSFCGMIGGVSHQALYVIGYQDDKVICLDPHYVQDEEEPQKIRYFKKTPRGLPFVQLCQSVSFCFYFPDIGAYRTWAAELCHSSKLYAPYLVVGLEIQDPQQVIQKYRKRSEDFQIL